MSVFVQPIYTQTVGAGGAASISFNNIPQGFTDLKLVMSVRGSNALANAYGIIGMNGAVSNQGTYIVFNGSVSSGAFTSFFYYTPSEQTANTFGVTEIYIPNYTSGNYKQLIIDSASEANSTAGYMNLQSVSTSFTGPITSLTLSGNGGTFLQHSTFTLYGVSSHFDVAAPLAPTIGAVTDRAGFASVAFTPAANDGADSYVVTSNPSGSTTYGALSPIITPATLDTSYTYQVAAVNSKGTSVSAASSALTTFNSYTSITSTTVGSGGAASVTLSNIPQGYKNLELRIIGKSTRSGANNFLSDLQIQFNTISSTSYSYHNLFSFGGTSGSGTINSTAVGFQVVSADGDGSMPNQFGGGIFTILDYSNTNKNKVGYGIGGTNTVSAYVDLVSLQSGALYSVAPITSITLTPSLGTWKQYSTISLYGVN
jgi:hypothetical protein